MNIAFLIKGFVAEEKDAAITTVIALAKGLIKKGHNVHLISAGKHKTKFSKVQGIPVHQVKFCSGKGKIVSLLNQFLGTPSQIKKIEKRESVKFDIIHSFSAAFPLSLIGYFAKRKAKFVHTIKSYSLYDKHWFSPGNLFWVRFLNLADKVTLPSINMKNKFVKRGLKTNKAEIINSFIELDKFKPESKSTLKKKYNLKGKKVALYYGQWGRQKGVRRLIGISPELNKSVSDLKILFVHPSYPESKDKEYFDKFKEQGNLELIQKKVKIQDYINLADVVVLPYTTIKGTETNPLCIIESMACKTPIVTADFPEIREMLEPGKDALLVKNDLELKDAIIKILKDSKLAKSLTNSAHKKVKEYSANIAVDKFEKLYKSLL